MCDLVYVEISMRMSPLTHYLTLTYMLLLWLNVFHYRTTAAETSPSRHEYAKISHTVDPNVIDNLLGNEKSTCLYSHTLGWRVTSFERGGERGWCLTEEEEEEVEEGEGEEGVLTILPPFSTLRASEGVSEERERELVGGVGVVVAAEEDVDSQLEVQVHAGLSDAPANSSACLLSEEANESCTFRSAVALCVEHLTAASKNCTIILSVSDNVRVDSAFGQMPRVAAGLGTLVIEGRGSKFSPADGSGTMQLLYAASSVTGTLSVSISNCHVSNFGNETLKGGAVFLNGVTDSRMENCKFTNNTALTGGAVHFGSSSSNVEIVFCDFFDNFAVEMAGGLYIGSFNFKFAFMNVSFWNNTAYNGGGLFVNNENVDFTMNHCSFHGNIVGGVGGGAFIYSNSKRYIMRNCDFTENSAVKYYGGGLYLYSRNQVELHDVRFVGNKAMYGGGLNGDSDNDYSLVSNCYFESNTASFGGAMTFYASHVFLVIENSTFHMNHATISGGGMYFGVNNDDFLLQDLHFSNNTAAVSI